MDNKLLQLAALAGIALTASIASATPYGKVLVGNTLTNQAYSSRTPWYDTSATNALFAVTQNHIQNNSNLLTPGLAFGADRQVSPNLRLGLELEGLKQLDNTKFTDYINSTNVSPPGGLLVNIRSRNDYNAKLSLVVGMGDWFYVKAGPAFLREKFVTELASPANVGFVGPVKVHNNKNFFGLGGAVGFNYKFSELYSVFSEIGYTHYGQKNLKDITIPAARLETPTAGDGDLTQYHGRKFRYAQSTIFVGIRANLIN